MNRVAFRGALGLLIVALGSIRCPCVSAQDVVAVLSSDSLPYREALAGFKETFSQAVPTYTLSKDSFLPKKSPKVIVTFGGKAAFYPYPRGTTLIYAVAPGLLVEKERHDGPLVKVRVLVSPEVLLSRLREVQPGLKRLAVLWISPTFIDHFHDLEGLAKARGITLYPERMSSVEELPSRLRALKGQVQAFWMEPDPLLMTPSAFAVANEFARSNSMPLYVSMDSLVDKGAFAAVSCSFQEMGRVAGQLAARAVEGKIKDGETPYIEKSSLTLNLTAAAQSGLVIPPAIISKADRVVP